MLPYSDSNSLLWEVMSMIGSVAAILSTGSIYLSLLANTCNRTIRNGLK